MPLHILLPPQACLIHPYMVTLTIYLSYVYRKFLYENYTISVLTMYKYRRNSLFRLVLLLFTNLLVGLSDAYLHIEAYNYIGSTYPYNSAPAFAVLKFTRVSNGKWTNKSVIIIVFFIYSFFLPFQYTATAISFYYSSYFGLHVLATIALSLNILSVLSYFYLSSKRMKTNENQKSINANLTFTQQAYYDIKGKPQGCIMYDSEKLEKVVIILFSQLRTYIILILSVDVISYTNFNSNYKTFIIEHVDFITETVFLIFPIIIIVILQFKLYIRIS